MPSHDGQDEIEDVEGRGFSSSGGYTKGIKFPSIEVALLALAFLTFATQFIVNVQVCVKYTLPSDHLTLDLDETVNNNRR